MPSEGNSAGANEDRLRRLEQKFDELQEASNSLKFTNRVVSILLVLVSVTLVVRLLMPLYELYENRNLVAQLMMKDMEHRVAPMIKSEAELLYKEDLKDWLDKEIADRKKRTLPKLMTALENEAGMLLKDMTDRMQARLGEEAASFNKRYSARFRKEFPELADDKQAELIIGNMQSALEHAADRILDDYFQKHREALLSMGSTFDRVQVPVEIAEMSNDALVEHALGLLAEIVAIRFDVEGEFSLDNSGPAASAAAAP